jgi:hypothetical protein
MIEEVGGRWRAGPEQEAEQKNRPNSSRQPTNSSSVIDTLRPVHR